MRHTVFTFNSQQIPEILSCYKTTAIICKKEFAKKLTQNTNISINNYSSLGKCFVIDKKKERKNSR